MTHEVDNIKLDYPVIIKGGDDAYFADRCEIFMDEHAVQWIKFVAKNGYYAGKEHMIQTRLVMIIRNDGRGFAEENQEHREASATD
jgi:hypothetical protein